MLCTLKAFIKLVQIKQLSKAIKINYFGSDYTDFI